MTEFCKMMTPEELFAEMLTLKVGERIDIAARTNHPDDLFVDDAEGWSGILRIDADIFDEHMAWLLDYYGGEAAYVIALSGGSFDDKYVRSERVEQLEKYLKDWDILQPNGKVAVEVTEPTVMKRGKDD